MEGELVAKLFDTGLELDGGELTGAVLPEASVVGAFDLGDDRDA